MKDQKIEPLRNAARKMIRELGMLELNAENSRETPAHWHALIEVDKNPGITISELGHMLLMKMSTISRLVKSLAKLELLELKKGKDQREKSLFLTGKGVAEIEKINAFSDSKIRGAFEFLADEEIEKILSGLFKYGEALERSRKMQNDAKILTLSTSRMIRKQIMNMVSDIQKNEFSIPIPKDINLGILKAENEYHFYNSCNFWYAVHEDDGKILGCIGLKKINDDCGEIKKFFVIKEYRSTGVAQKLMSTLLKAALKHQLKTLVLGTTDRFHAAHKFYDKYGFISINKEEMPSGLDLNPCDNLFYRKELFIPPEVVDGLNFFPELMGTVDHSNSN